MWFFFGVLFLFSAQDFLAHLLVNSTKTTRKQQQINKSNTIVHGCGRLQSRWRFHKESYFKRPQCSKYSSSTSSSSSTKPTKPAKPTKPTILSPPESPLATPASPTTAVNLFTATASLHVVTRHGTDWFKDDEALKVPFNNRDCKEKIGVLMIIYKTPTGPEVTFIVVYHASTIFC